MSHSGPLTVYTVGHSTRSIDEFGALLTDAGVELVVDVRAIPRSRTNPQFNRDALPASLAPLAIGYQHIAELGGRRGRAREAPPSANTFWRNTSFRNYADYAATEAFRSGLERLREYSARQHSVIMCSETLWWRCHRRIISDYLLADGVAVLHIMGPHKIEPATLTPNAQRLDDGTLVYLA
jgi:uncharacterized protein (DUF488 family)